MSSEGEEAGGEKGELKEKILKDKEQGSGRVEVGKNLPFEVCTPLY